MASTITVVWLSMAVCTGEGAEWLEASRELCSLLQPTQSLATDRSLAARTKHSSTQAAANPGAAGELLSFFFSFFFFFCVDVSSTGAEIRFPAVLLNPEPPTSVSGTVREEQIGL